MHTNHDAASAIQVQAGRVLISLKGGSPAATYGADLINPTTAR